MKIGIFTDAYEPLISGVVVSINALRKSLQNLGHEVFIITTNNSLIKQEKDPHIIRIKGIPLPFKIFQNYRWVLRYKHHLSLIKTLNLDVIHVQTEFGLGLLGIYAKKKLKLPLVYTLHTMYVSFFEINNSFFIKLFRRWMLKYANKIVKRCLINADAVIAPTQKVFNFLTKSYSINTNFAKSNYYIVPTGLNLNNFYPQSHPLEKVLQLKNKLSLENYFVCLYVGRISQEKEIDYLINAFAMVLKKHPQTKFLIIGDGPEKNNLQKQVFQLGIKDRVIFLGFIPYENLGIYYQLGDCFLSASLFETQGLTYIEALASGLPVIARYDAALEGVIKDEKNGLFYRLQEELIVKLSNLIVNSFKHQYLALQAYQSVKSFSQEIFGEKLLKIYQNTIKNNNKNKKIIS